MSIRGGGRFLSFHASPPQEERGQKYLRTDFHPQLADCEPVGAEVPWAEGNALKYIPWETCHLRLSDLHTQWWMFKPFFSVFRWGNKKNNCWDWHLGKWKSLTIWLVESFHFTVQELKIREVIWQSQLAGNLSYKSGLLKLAWNHKRKSFFFFFQLNFLLSQLTIPENLRQILFLFDTLLSLRSHYSCHGLFRPVTLISAQVSLSCATFPNHLM